MVELSQLTVTDLFPKGRVDTAETVGIGRIRPHKSLEVEFLNCSKKVSDKTCVRRGIVTETLKIQGPLNDAAIVRSRSRQWGVGQQGRLLLPCI